jgi:uncharacterized protein (TIGR01244 family)
VKLGVEWGFAPHKLLLASVGLCLALGAAAGPDVKNYYQHSPLLATGGLINPAALADLKAQGFTQIIDLRQPTEGIEAERLAAEAHGLHWHNLPTGGELPGAERLQTFGALLSQGKTLVHCRSGNRVGMTWALWQLTQGVDLESALAQGRAMGMKADFEQAIRARVAADRAP